MRKLSLNPDQLRVESFTTDPSPAGRGTVAAHAATNFGCRTDPAFCGTLMRVQSCYASCTEDNCAAF